LFFVIVPNDGVVFKPYTDEDHAVYTCSQIKNLSSSNGRSHSGKSFFYKRVMTGRTGLKTTGRFFGWK